MTASFDNGTELDGRPHTSSARMRYRPRPSRAARLFRWWLAQPDG